MRADWSRTQAVYRQCLEAVEAGVDQPYLPGQLPSFLAELLSRLSVSYFDAYDEFISDASSELDPDLSLGDLYTDQRYQLIPEYSHSGVGRRRPTPFEAIVETCRRLRDVQSVKAALAPWTVGGILGGSTSYGRFLNVQGNVSGQASDIDLFVVVDDPFAIAKLLDSLEGVPGVAQGAILRAQDRYSEYLELVENEQSAELVFSCKIGLWDTLSDQFLEGIAVDSRYFLSLHILPISAARKVFMGHATGIERHSCGSEATLRDFRETPAARVDHQRSFSARNLRIELSSEEFRTSYVRETKIFVIDSGDYYFPGMFQNLVIPAFDIKWGDEAFHKLVESFRWKLVERLRYERRVHQDDMLRISFSHTRSLVFAPHVVRAVDASTHLS